jgi:hypothetical protein
VSEASSRALKDGVTYRHERIIDFMLSNPQMRKGEIAAALGFTQAWFSTITASDAFKAEYQRRRADYNERLAEGVVSDLYEQTQLAAKRILAELADPECAPGFALEVQGRALNHLGFGDGKARPTAGGASVVVNVASGVDPTLLAQARHRLLEASSSPPVDGECPALPAIFYGPPELAPPAAGRGEPSADEAEGQVLGD